MADAQQLDYVGRLPCGCYVTWCSSRITGRELGKTLADWAKRGFSIERMATDDVREKFKAKCPHKENSDG